MLLDMRNNDLNAGWAEKTHINFHEDSGGVTRMKHAFWEGGGDLPKVKNPHNLPKQRSRCALPRRL